MINRLTALVAILAVLTPALLGAGHIEGETYLPYLFAVFAVVWVAFFVYLYFISRKQADLKRDIDALLYETTELEDD